MNFFQKIKMVFRDDWSDMIGEYVRKFNSGEPLPILGSSEINETAAMKYTAVFSCCRVLSETFASMPVMLYRKKENGDRESRNDLGIHDVLHNAPNAEMSPFNFKESCMMALNLGGNSVSERLVNRFGEVVGLYPYQWQNASIKRSKETNKLVYEIKDGSRKKELTRDQVFHIPGLSLDGINGISPIEYAASAIRLGLDRKSVV